MSGVKIPSIQHAAGIWDPHPATIAKRLLSLAKKAPPFSYQNLYLLAADLLRGSASYDQLVRAVEGMRHPLARKSYLEILPLLDTYANGVKPDIVGQVSPRNYSIGRDLRVLVNPPLIYYRNAEAHLPWFVFWKRNFFNDVRLRLFVTMMREVFAQDPDIDDASLSLVVCSETQPGAGRRLTVTDAAEIPSLSAEDRTEMLKIFAEGYAMAVSAHAAGRGLDPDYVERRDDDEDQLDLFA